MVAALVSALICAGCGSKEFNEGVAQQRVMDDPVKLDGEQVVLTERQIDCGVKNDLWEAPAQSGDHKTAHLLPKGQELKFYGDVTVDDSAMGSYAQVRGDFKLELMASEIKDLENGVKMVTGKAGAVISHTCFPSSLPVMGVRKGQFAPDAPMQLRFVLDGSTWRFDRIEH